MYCLCHTFFSGIEMPRIVNGQIVDDEPAKSPSDKPRVMTWRNFSERPTAEEGTRNRASNQDKPEEKKGEAPPPPPPSGIVQFFSSMLGIENYNLKIPNDNPTVVINAVYFLFFLFFTLIFGYKMAVILFCLILRTVPFDRSPLSHRAQPTMVCLFHKYIK